MPLHPAETADITTLADSCFSFVVTRPDELQRFMNFAGYTADSIRKDVGTEGLNRALLDYFAGHEPALMAMCEETGVEVEHFMSAWQRLNRAM